MIPKNRSVLNYTKPKNRVLKFTILVIILIILGLGSWIGWTAYRSINKITADSSGGNILNLFDDLTKHAIKGQTEGRTNILLLGNGGKNHPGGGLTDTMIVLSINWQNKKVAMISVPRDLWVKISGNSYAKINYAYFYGNQNPKLSGGGGKVASDTISEVVGLPIHYYVSLDFDGFKKIVDTVGGIDIDVDKELYDPYYPAANMVDYDPFRISVGMHHMDGNLALKYARSRETTSDFDRSRRQQQVLAAIKEKTLSLETLSNPKKVTDLIIILGDHLKTNLSVGEIRSLWDQIKGIDTANMTNKVLDTTSGSPLTSLQDERGYIIVPKKGIGNFTDIQKIAQNIFSNNVAIDQVEDLRIEILNGTSKPGLAMQISQLLQGYGYKIARVGNATSQISETTIYNCSGKNAESKVKDLSAVLKANIKTKTACANIDIQIVLGQNSL